MYGWSRSSGLGFWTSLVYSNVGSFAWEMAGETSPPSINDLITTGQAGSLLSETLYRIADLVLKDNGGEVARRFHKYLAMLLDPPTALNRHIFGRRLKTGLPDSAPATAWQIGIGARVDAHASDPSLAATQLRRNATVQLSMSYGLPGTPGYDYTRPSSAAYRRGQWPCGVPWNPTGLGQSVCACSRRSPRMARLPPVQCAARKPNQNSPTSGPA